MKFFYGCTSDKEAKEIYHKLAKCFHPDKGGNAELMKELTTQYETWDAPEVDTNPFHQSPRFTPNNRGFGRNPFQRMSPHFDMEAKIQAKDFEIGIWKARHADIIKDNEFYINRVTDLKKELQEKEKFIEDLRESLVHSKENNEKFISEISRLTKLKEPKNMIERLKNLFT